MQEIDKAIAGCMAGRAGMEKSKRGDAAQREKVKEVLTAWERATIYLGVVMEQLEV